MRPRALVLLGGVGAAGADHAPVRGPSGRRHGETRLAARIEYAAASSAGAGAAGQALPNGAVLRRGPLRAGQRFRRGPGAVLLGTQPRAKAACGSCPATAAAGASVALSPRGRSRPRSQRARWTPMWSSAAPGEQSQVKAEPARRCPFLPAQRYPCRGTIMAVQRSLGVGLGNSRCDEIEFEGGMGRSARFRRGRTSIPGRGEDGHGRAHPAGSPAVGRQDTMDKFLSSFEPAGLIRAGTRFNRPTTTDPAAPGSGPHHGGGWSECGVGGLVRDER